MPCIGRWISCDPLGLKKGNDLYQYARSNPVRFIDPGGQESLDTAIYQGTEILGETLKEVGAALRPAESVVAAAGLLDAAGDRVLQVPRAMEGRLGLALGRAMQTTTSPIATVNEKSAVMPADLLRSRPEELAMDVIYQGAVLARPILQRTLSATAAVGHAMEALGGAALCTTIVGCSVGAVAIAHGLDNFSTDAEYTFTGNYRTPGTERLLQWGAFLNPQHLTSILGLVSSCRPSQPSAAPRPEV